MLQIDKQRTEEYDYLLNVYKQFKVEFEYGKGAKLYDRRGVEYLDFLSGISVTNLGHNNSAIKNAVEEQFNKLWHTSNLFVSSSQNKLARSLCNKSGLKGVFFSNSGTEANEAAIKFARLWGKERFEIITAINSFHGRTMGSLSATGQFKLWKDFKPLLPGFKFVQFGDINALKNNIGEFTCAVMLETIQGEGGIVLPSDNYLKEVENLCRENKLLLIIDEIQTGLGRTGKFFAYEHYGIKPDIVTLAKGIANGLPLGATICSENIAANIFPGSHGSTFGGNPLSVSAALAVLGIIDQKLLNSISDLGKILKDGILSLNLPFVKSVRGLGLMIGIEIDENICAADIANKLFERNILTCAANGNVLRLLPPFVIDKNDINFFIENLYEIHSIK